MDLQLKGKKAIVTGGSAGIGLTISRMLAEEGVQVTIPGRNLKKVNEAIATLPDKAHAVEADLGTAEGARKLIAQVLETDILVNNLGIYESKDFTKIADEDWLHYFEVNLLGHSSGPTLLPRNAQTQLGATSTSEPRSAALVLHRLRSLHTSANTSPEWATPSEFSERKTLALRTGPAKPSAQN